MNITRKKESRGRCPIVLAVKLARVRNNQPIQSTYTQHVEPEPQQIVETYIEPF